MRLGEPGAPSWADERPNEPPVTLTTGARPDTLRAMTTVDSILLAPTPASWVDYAAEHWRELLTDHANCEKKAASTALALMFAYPEDRKLSGALSRLAREELRHFEQVQRMMDTLDVPYVRQKPGRYGGGLRAVTRTSDPGRKLDLMIVGALIEARSCERFRLLVPKLPAPLAEFYATLANSEARHFELYLELAKQADTSSDGTEAERRLQAIAEREADLATAPDDAFRFHSGAPA
ncbi:MAG TPA: tRNA-(ms[2]io[6]A)-hydroxylase [Steroidobacteraceae bacterium]|jgi:tRNA-(ms[2]io[6]A)-hydroxylase|nr:tRNA-(ms[2]io[6]A)-hydroxylase [Steroidobacteraceae bacterium]